MKREYCYLPDLNSLFAQKVRYQKHLEGIRKSKSSYDYAKDMIVQSREVGEGKRQAAKLKAEEFQSPVRKLKEAIIMKYNSVSPPDRGKGMFSPYERRKLSERNQQNNRIYKALLDSNPAIYRPDPKSSEVHQHLKQRISKFLHEGNSVKYKYKRSLAEIMRRKKKQKMLEIENPAVVEEVRKQLDHWNERRCRTHLETPKNSDLYLHSNICQEKSKLQEKKRYRVNSESKVEEKRGKTSLYGSVKSERQKSVVDSKQSEKQMIQGDSKSECILMKARNYLNRRTVMQQVLTTKVKQSLKKQKEPFENVYPKSEVLLQNQRRKQLSDLEIIAFPQVSKDISMGSRVIEKN